AGASFVTYMEEALFKAIDAVRAAARVDKINAVGYCIGGTLLATSLAYMARKGDARIQSATFFAAQADFELAGELKVFTDESAIDYVKERMTASGGVLDSQAMADTFNALRSGDLVWNYVVENYYLGKRPPPFDLLFWNSDQTRMPSALHLFYLQRFYNDNALAKGELVIQNERLSLKDVTIPIYMQAAREDHIAPAASVYRTARAFGGPVEFMMAGSGHIAGVINPPEAKKYQHWINPWLPETFEQWLADAGERPGSWWPHWASWLGDYAGDLIPARQPGDGGLDVLGPAPGEYVKVKSAP
ncbi:MAG: PHA/PHB synthase family protein, partial [Hyphomonadaceae bacterium]